MLLVLVWKALTTVVSVVLLLLSGSVCGPILLQLHYDVFSLFLVKRKH